MYEPTQNRQKQNERSVRGDYLASETQRSTKESALHKYIGRSECGLFHFFITLVFTHTLKFWSYHSFFFFFSYCRLFSVNALLFIIYMMLSNFGGFIASSVWSLIIIFFYRINMGCIVLIGWSEIDRSWMSPQHAFASKNKKYRFLPPFFKKED